MLSLSDLCFLNGCKGDGMKSEELALLKDTAESLKRAIACAESITTQLQQSNTRKWVTGLEAEAALGSAFSADFLARQARLGVLQHSVHFVRKTDSSFGYNVAKLREFYETPPEKRAINK